MSALEWFITLWVCVIFAMAIMSWWDGRRTSDLCRTNKRLTAEVAEADAWCIQHVKNTANFHRANRYYHEFE